MRNLWRRISPVSCKTPLHMFGEKFDTTVPCQVEHVVHFRRYSTISDTSLWCRGPSQSPTEGARVTTARWIVSGARKEHRESQYRQIQKTSRATTLSSLMPCIISRTAPRMPSQSSMPTSPHLPNTPGKSTASTFMVVAPTVLGAVMDSRRKLNTPQVK